MAHSTGTLASAGPSASSFWRTAFVSAMHGLSNGLSTGKTSPSDVVTSNSLRGGRGGRARTPPRRSCFAIASCASLVLYEVDAETYTSVRALTTPRKQCASLTASSSPAPSAVGSATSMTRRTRATLS